MLPVTVISTEFTSEMLRNWIEQGEPAVREFVKIRDVDDVDLPTGHWTRFTRPEEFGSAILGARETGLVEVPPVTPLGGRAYREEP